MFDKGVGGRMVDAEKAQRYYEVMERYGGGGGSGGG
jgi:hypothetical protein